MRFRKGDVRFPGGASKHPHYSRVTHIYQRCLDPKNDNYKYYGQRGIKLHQPWADDLGEFLLWIDRELGPCPEGMSLDRIDNDGHYEPGNLQWATSRQQLLNTRRTVSKTLRITEAPGRFMMEISGEKKIWYDSDEPPPAFFWIGLIQQYGGQIINVEHEVIT